MGLWFAFSWPFQDAFPSAMPVGEAKTLSQPPGFPRARISQITIFTLKNPPGSEVRDESFPRDSVDPACPVLVLRGGKERSVPALGGVGAFHGNWKSIFRAGVSTSLGSWQQGRLAALHDRVCFHLLCFALP